MSPSCVDLEKLVNNDEKNGENAQCVGDRHESSIGDHSQDVPIKSLATGGIVTEFRSEPTGEGA